MVTRWWPTSPLFRSMARRLRRRPRSGSAKAGVFVPLDDGLQAEVAVVMAACPDLADEENDRSVSDPFVVALAKHTNGTVVTGEKPRKSPNGRRKIPDACAELHVPCLNWFDFLTEIG